MRSVLLTCDRHHGIRTSGSGLTAPLDGAEVHLGATPGGPVWVPDGATELAQNSDRRALIRETIHETAARTSEPSTRWSASSRPNDDLV
jgi:hypothetical protein